MSSVADHFVKNLFADKVKLEVIYGSTEAGIMSFFNEDLSKEHVRTGECGRIRDGVEIKVFSKERLKRTLGERMYVLIGIFANIQKLHPH